MGGARRAAMDGDGQSLPLTSEINGGAAPAGGSGSSPVLPPVPGRPSTPPIGLRPLITAPAVPRFTPPATPTPSAPPATVPTVPRVPVGGSSSLGASAPVVPPLGGASMMPPTTFPPRPVMPPVPVMPGARRGAPPSTDPTRTPPATGRSTGAAGTPPVRPSSAPASGSPSVPPRTPGSAAPASTPPGLQTWLQGVHPTTTLRPPVTTPPASSVGTPLPPPGPYRAAGASPTMRATPPPARPIPATPPSGARPVFPTQPSTNAGLGTPTTSIPPVRPPLPASRVVPTTPAGTPLARPVIPSPQQPIGVPRVPQIPVRPAAAPVTRPPLDPDATRVRPVIPATGTPSARTPSAPKPAAAPAEKAPAVIDTEATRIQPAVKSAGAATIASPATTTAKAAPIPNDPDATRIQPAVRDGEGGGARRAAGERGGRRAAPARATTGSRVRGLVLEIVLVLVCALVISAVVRTFLVEVYTVPSGSMENTLMNGDRIVAVEVGTFHRGDIVVFKDPGGWLAGEEATSEQPGPVRNFFEKIRVLPDSKTDHLVKRVIGMPGDHVQCCDAQGQIMVNGYSLDERAYLHATDGVTDYPSQIQFNVWVPADTIFVMGDHRSDSYDSRYHLCDTSTTPAGLAAFVPISDVVGPVKAVLTPLKRIQSFDIPATFANVPAHPSGTPPADPVVYSAQCPS